MLRRGVPKRSMSRGLSSCLRTRRGLSGFCAGARFTLGCAEVTLPPPAVRSGQPCDGGKPIVRAVLIQALVVQGSVQRRH